MLIDEIRALPTEMLAAEDTAQIAAALNVGRTAVSDYWLTDRGLVADLVASTGSTEMSDSILTKLDQAATASRSVKAITNRLYNDPTGINFGESALRGWIASMTPGLFTVPERDALLGLAVKPSSVSVDQINALCWSENGVWQV
jgi:predicted transcriptional regulator